VDELCRVVRGLTDVPIKSVTTIPHDEATGIRGDQVRDEIEPPGDYAVYNLTVVVSSLGCCGAVPQPVMQLMATENAPVVLILYGPDALCASQFNELLGVFHPQTTFFKPCPIDVRYFHDDLTQHAEKIQGAIREVLDKITAWYSSLGK
jgi:hypothetical protein